MFGFLIGSEVNDDAIALKKLVDISINKYSTMKFKDITKSISQNFNDECYSITFNSADFYFKELEEFSFSIMKSNNDASPHGLSVSGRGKYAGFMLQVSDESIWHCSALDRINFSVTGGSKKLVKILEKKYGIKDISALMKKYS